MQYKIHSRLKLTVEWKSLVAFYSPKGKRDKPVLFWAKSEEYSIMGSRLELIDCKHELRRKKK